MISIKRVKLYCCENISLIENYDKAINDKTQIWVCHHKLEIELNLTQRELIEIRRYFDVPASELIFMTRSDHTKLHTQGEKNPMYRKNGKDNPMYGKNHEDYMSIEAIKEKRRKQSTNATGAKNGRYHTKQMYKDGIFETVKYEDIDTYLNNGWIIKGRPWHK